MITFYNLLQFKTPVSLTTTQWNANFNFRNHALNAKLSPQIKISWYQIFQRGYWTLSAVFGISQWFNQRSELYNSELLAIIDNHAPLATQQVTIRPAAPWYTDAIKCEKRIRRRLERRWRVTRQPSDHLNFTRQCHRVSALLSASRSQYYSELVKEMI